MRQTVPKLNSLDVVGKPIRMLILVMNRQFETGAKRQSQRFVSVHYLNAIDISNEHIKHGDLITEGMSALLHHHSDFPVFLECLDRLIINKLDDWVRGGFTPVRIR